MRKRVFGFVFCCVTVCMGILFFSCATTAPAQKEGAALSDLAEELRTLKLAAGERWVRDLNSSEEAWNVSAASVANVMLTLDEWFDFQGKLDPATINALAKDLFYNLPKLDKPGECRVVAIGGIYGGDSPLIVIISQFELREGIVPGQSFGLQYITNSAKFRTEDKETKILSNVGTGTYINSEVNYRRQMIPMEDGHLVLAGNLNQGKETVGKAKDDGERANLMDTFIKDEDKSNDAEIEGLHQSIVSKENVDPLVRLVAEMNWGLFLLKQGRIDEAESHWKLLRPLVPENADASVSKAVDNDVPFLLSICRAW